MESKLVLDLGNKANAWVHVNHKKLADKNADIIDEIRKIVSQ